MSPGHAKAIVTATLAIIVGTNLLMAPATGPLIRAMRLKASEKASSIGAVGEHLSAYLLPLIADGDSHPSEGAPPAGAALASDAVSDPERRGSGPESVRSVPLQRPLAVRAGASASAAMNGRSRAFTFPGLGIGAAPLDTDGNGNGTARPPRWIIGGNAVHRAWRLLDQHYMKPLFGGRAERDGREDETSTMFNWQRGGRTSPAPALAAAAASVARERSGGAAMPVIHEGGGGASSSTAG